MKAKRTKADSALAFVDVITNGLGGMLILFFLSVALQAVLEWHAEAGQDKQNQKSDFPFVMIVRPVDQLPCFSAKPVGHFNVKQAFDPKRGTNIDWDKDYFLLVLNRPVSAFEDEIALVPNRDVELLVEAYPSGAEKLTYTIQAKSEGSAIVWPPLYQGKK